MRWILSLIGLFGCVVNAANLEVFCTDALCKQFEIQTRKGIYQRYGQNVDVYVLDGTKQFETLVSGWVGEQKPVDQAEGELVVSELLNSPEGQEALADVNWTINGLNLAIEWSLDKLPAYVCNRTTVIYGGSVKNAYEQCLAQSKGGTR